MRGFLARWVRVLLSRCLGCGLFCAMLMIGCTATGRSVDRGPCQASSEPYERDIPLPSGFVLADQSSEDWSGGAVRYVRHRYTGTAEKFAVRTFYRQQMPRLRWKPVSDGNVHGRISMRFEREDEVAVIAISNQRRGSPGKVFVEVLITPLVR